MTEISYFFKTRVKGSVTPLIYGRDAKDLRDSEDSTKLKNIPTSSSGDKFGGGRGVILAKLAERLTPEEKNT